jgi:hypothetical protein
MLSSARGQFCRADTRTPAVQLVAHLYIHRVTPIVTFTET